MFKRFASALMALCVVPLAPASAQDFEMVFGKMAGGGLKICSVVVDSAWRNDLMVPMAWSEEDCAGWAGKIGVGVYNLACLLEHKVQYNDAPGWNTCGW